VERRGKREKEGPSRAWRCSFFLGNSQSC
jgi:hypothetical protein